MCNIYDRSHLHTYLLLVLEKNNKTNPNQLLDHFRRSLDCTEHVQQAIKPYVILRGRVLSREGFSVDCTHKIYKEREKMLEFSKSILKREKIFEVLL